MGQRALLLALGYPKAQAFSAADEAAFRGLIVWLENVKIRSYPVDERKELGDVKSGSWRDAFVKWLQDVDCPLHLATDNANRGAVLQWLLHYAVSLEYSDHADEYNATLKQLQQQQQQRQQDRHAASKQQQQQHQHAQQPFPDLHNPQVQQQVATLLQLLHVDTSKGSLADQLRAASDMLRDSVLPSLTDAAVQHHAIVAGQLDTALLGFSTGDARVDQLSTVLRLLYIKDLRQLQTAIDRMVVDVQEFTANPKTDASLGKVGR